MAKKNKKVDDIVLEDISLEETEEITDTPVEEKLEEIPVESVNEEAPIEEKKKAKKEPKVKAGGAFMALTIIISVIAFILFVGMIAISSFAIASEAISYSFWPFVGVILAAVFAIIVLVVALIGTRKSNHKTVRTKTIIVCILAFCLTCGIACVFDLLLPDVVAKLASNTIRYEEVVDDPLTQAETNGELVREFVRYNMLNGYYSEKDSEPAPYEYKKLKTDTLAGDETVEGSIAYYVAQAEADATYIDKIIAGYKSKETAGEDGFGAIVGTNRSYDYELYNFIYNWYVMTDYDYAFNVSYDEDDNLNADKRQAVAVAMTEYLKKDHAKLCQTGIEKNPRMKELFVNKFAQMDRESYVVLDQSSLLTYATSGRMTVPVVVRLLLDEHYRPGYYTMKIWDGANDKYSDVNVSWSVLDMNGVSEPITIALGDPVDLLSGVGFGDPAIVQVVLGLLASNADSLNNLLNIQLKFLVGGLTNTNEINPDYTTVLEKISTAANLTVVPELTDDNNLTILVNSNNVERGNLGYMQMAWTAQDTALFALISVVGSRNYLFIFGAIGVALIYAAGLCAEYARKAKEKKLAESEEAE